ncbi:MAG: serine/threonine-protein phosphatase [Desulfatitalea sp.]|nr:serine/threonine-protein phosphatase [Desulfatitalea sp.]
MNLNVIAEADTAALCMGKRRCYGISHKGLQRSTNEDRHLLKAMAGNGILMAVADGLGDEPACNNAAEIVKQSLADVEEIPAEHEEIALKKLAQRIDCAIYTEGLRRPGAEGMGSTLLAVLVRDGVAHWVHVGDSRLYLYRNGSLRQVTEDQTLARFLVAEMEITPEQALTHYSRNVMDQCVGCGFARPETGTLQIQPHDLLILSTDGLHMQIGHSTFSAIVGASTDINGKADALIRAALGAGGPDNITVVLMGTH